MIRDITIGQYYPTDSIVHRLDPRTKLVGTMVFIITLFLSDSIWGYLLATAALACSYPADKGAVSFHCPRIKSNCCAAAYQRQL